MKNSSLFVIFSLFFVQLNAQGLINNGAAIIINGASTVIYVDGDANGNFVNQNNGVIDNISGAMYVEGNFTNNAATSNVFINNTTNLGTVFFNGATTSEITGATKTIFENITILNSNRKLAVTDCQTNGVLTLNDVGLLLDTNRFIVNNTSVNGITVVNNGYLKSETTSAPYGELLWAVDNTTAVDYIIPFGIGNSAAQKFDMIVRPVSGITSSFTVATYPTAANNLPYPPTVTHVNDYTTGINQSNNTVDRFWELLVTGSPVLNLTLNCLPTEAPLPILNPLPQRWIAASNGWELPTNTGTPFSISATSAKMDGFSNIATWWTMASELFPLPIDVNFIETECRNGNVAINWKTENEKRNSFYEIQTASAKELVFETQKSIFSKLGLSNYYSVTLPTNLNSDNAAYVRLKTVGENGEISYSNTAKINSNCNTNSQTRIIGFYQNDNNCGSLFTDVFNDEEFTLQVFDTRGRLVINNKQKLYKGQAILPIDLSNFSSSLYFANLIGESGSYAATKLEIIK